MMTPAELREWRTAAGLTQVQLAELLDLPEPAKGGQVTVARWESGKHPPPAYLWRALRDIEVHG